MSLQICSAGTTAELNTIRACTTAKHLSSLAQYANPSDHCPALVRLTTHHSTAPHVVVTQYVHTNSIAVSISQSQNLYSTCYTVLNKSV